MSWFKKKVELSDDFVELSIGRVYYKPLLNQHIRFAENRSGGSWTIYFTYIELQTLNLKQSLYERLTVLDGEKVRNKTKEILKRYGIEEPTKTIDDEWSETDKKWFREQQALAEEKLQKYVTKVVD